MAVHCLARSCYSLLQGTMTPDLLVRNAKERGYTSIALSDRNRLYGVPDYISACAKYGMRPLIGLEIDVQVEGSAYPFLVLAKNDAGYKGLMRLSSQVACEPFKIGLTDIEPYKENIYFVVFGEGGLLEEAMVKDDRRTIVDRLADLHKMFPDLLAACSYEEAPFWHQRNDILRGICKSISIRTLALSKVYYAQRADETAFRVLNAIGTQQTLADKNLPTFEGRWMLTPDEMERIYPADELALSDEIARSCNYTFTPAGARLPKFTMPSNIDAKQYLTQLCLQGLKKRLESDVMDPIYLNRLKSELGIITDMHYEDYFLIVWDFIRYARKQGIYVGPGRGSAAGTLVAYCLGITHVDPVKFNLIFERFLNPERISMPDIDIDFPDNRRDEVIAYVVAKYGKDHVAHICTFGTLAAKQALRDVGRVLGISVRDMDMISKTIPNTLKITLPKAKEESRHFAQLIESSEKFKELYLYASALEGLPRHVSTHAAGIVLSDCDLVEVIPLVQIETDLLSTQFTMEHLEPMGLIKMDFLGLRNLTIIDDVVKLIKQEGGDLDPLKLPLDDKKTYDLIASVDTVGIFQLESEGMKSLIRKMHPDRFDDIVATIALFRPGPMENIPEYLKRRQNPNLVQYPHADLKDILGDTYGIMIYQEQIMLVAQKMAGFSMARADVLRKAMSKKSSKELAKLQEEFIEGCVKKGYTQALGIELFNLTAKFANYGFNKSHSVAYAMISYQMAYLKANYPDKFFASLLSSVIGSESKTAEYVNECRMRKVGLLAPSVNRSDAGYRLEDGWIRFPLTVIKGVGNAACQEILAERVKGLFLDYYDFVARILTHRFTRKNIEALIDAGALDDFAMTRKSMLASLDEACTYADLVRIDTLGQSRIDLDLVSRPIPISVADHAHERSERERDVFGFYFSSHPILVYKQKNDYRCNPIVTTMTRHSNVRAAVMVEKVKPYRTKGGQMMAFVTVSDETAFLDLVVMPNIYDRTQELWVKGNLVEIEGQIEEENSCMVKNVRQLKLEN
jgi:DNA polymerase-3 subunit alpha